MYLHIVMNSRRYISKNFVYSCLLNSFTWIYMVLFLRYFQKHFLDYQINKLYWKTSKQSWNNLLYAWFSVHIIHYAMIFFKISWACRWFYVSNSVPLIARTKKTVWIIFGKHELENRILSIPIKVKSKVLGNLSWSLIIVVSSQTTNLT